MPVLALLSMLSAFAAAGDTGQGPVRPVPAVDLARYAGRWYEIARLPNSFQAKCTGETTADYELLPNGQMRVVNQCRQADGTMKRAEGRARLADRKGPTSKLKVRFAPAFLSFLSAVWGDYWVLDLTDDYSAALVGEPGRRYLWVLSRTPVLADSICRRMLDTAVRQGFDVTRLVRSPAGSGGSCGG
jgi:apolipoprotein D and lipocalin family protein